MERGDKMASPQIEKGYTSIANELMEQIYGRKFTASQFRIILLVLRFTYGFKRKGAPLSNGFIAHGTGTHEITVSKEITSLIRDKVLKVYKNSTYQSPRVIGVNKNYDDWKNHPHIAEALTVSLQTKSKPTGLELAEALTVSENSERVSQQANLVLASTLTKKTNITKQTIKKEKEKTASPKTDEKKYDEYGRELNEAGWPKYDSGLSKSGIDF